MNAMLVYCRMLYCICPLFRATAVMLIYCWILPYHARPCATLPREALCYPTTRGPVLAYHARPCASLPREALC